MASTEAILVLAVTGPASTGQAVFRLARAHGDRPDLPWRGVQRHGRVPKRHVVHGGAEERSDACRRYVEIAGRHDRRHRCLRVGDEVDDHPTVSMRREVREFDIHRRDACTAPAMRCTHYPHNILGTSADRGLLSGGENRLMGGADPHERRFGRCLGDR